jgi:hypothetical protein
MNSQQIRPCDPTQQAAQVAVAPPARDQLEHLCRYVLRPPLTVERLTESSHGQLLYEVPHPRRDGSTHLLLDPLELIEKLSVLVPAPRLHLLRFHGVMAPHAARRSQAIPRPSAATSQAIEARVANAGPSAVAGSLPACSWGLSWSALLKRGLRHRCACLPSVRRPPAYRGRPHCWPAPPGLARAPGTRRSGRRPRTLALSAPVRQVSLSSHFGSLQPGLPRRAGPRLPTPRSGPARAPPPPVHQDGPNCSRATASVPFLSRPAGHDQPPVPPS